MTLTEILTEFGLEEKEAKVYLALLELGQTSVMQIAQKAAIKRPTTYIVLDTLGNKGFVTKTYKKQKLLFVPEQPEALLRSMKQKEELLRGAMPELRALVSTTKTRPKISIYEWWEGIRSLYQEIITSPEVTYFGSVKDIKRYFPDVIDEIYRIGKKQPIHARDILSNHPEDLEYARIVVSKTYEVRMLPPSLDFTIDCAIYGNKIAILAVKKDLFAVVIESKDVAGSFRSLHALAWKSALPLRRMKPK